MASVNPDSDFSSHVLDIISPAIVNSNRDLSLIPDGILTQEFVDTYLKSKCSASGDNHVSKGYKYFHEGYVRNRESEYCLSLLSEFYAMMTQAKLKFEYSGKVKLISTC